MKNLIKIIVLVLIVSIYSCSSDDDDKITLNSISFDFTHNFDDQKVAVSDFNDIKYTNLNGEEMSIERLRYLISKVRLVSTDTTITISGYNLVDLTNTTGLNFSPTEEIPSGIYDIIFNFGFNEDDNTDNAYADLTSVSWNVPAMLGGGYHYMQLEGRYTIDTQTYQYHTISAVQNPGPNPDRTDTHIEVNLGSVSLTDDATIEINMNIAEWFKNPNTWDLNILNSLLMSNFDAQMQMNENGQNVFSLGEVTQ